MSCACSVQSCDQCFAARRRWCACRCVVVTASRGTGVGVWVLRVLCGLCGLCVGRFKGCSVVSVLIWVCCF